MPLPLQQWMDQAKTLFGGGRQATSLGNVYGFLDPTLQRGLTPAAAERLQSVPVERGAQFGKPYTVPGGAVRIPEAGIPQTEWLHEAVHALDPSVRPGLAGWGATLGQGTMGRLPGSERQRIAGEYYMPNLLDRARYWLNQNEEQFAMTAQRVAQGRGIQPRYQQYYREIFTPEAMRAVRQDPRVFGQRSSGPAIMLPPETGANLRQLAGMKAV